MDLIHSYPLRYFISSIWQSVWTFLILCSALYLFLLGVQFENSSEVGVFAKLTAKYCITPLDNPQFYSAFEELLVPHIPVVQATFAGTKIIGRLCIGLCISQHFLFHVLLSIWQVIQRVFWFLIQQLTMS